MQARNCKRPDLPLISLNSADREEYAKLKKKKQEPW
jgi:hypothetical protein